LVAVETWDAKGQSFEFAHFTDRQLALAMETVDRRVRQPARPARVQAIRAVRSSRGNLESVIGHASKTELADALWPVLEQKIHRAQRRNTEARIPIVRHSIGQLTWRTNFHVGIWRSRSGARVKPAHDRHRCVVSPHHARRVREIS